MTQFRSKRLSRRTFLRGSIAGLGTVSLGLPVLESMLDQNGALAQGSPPFFGVFFWANGTPWHGEHAGGSDVASQDPAEYRSRFGNVLHPDLWTPASQGANYTPSYLLAPLAGHRVNVATGLKPTMEIPASPGGQADGHMRGFMAALTGDRPRSMGFNHMAHALTARRPSIDQYVASHPDFYARGEAPVYRSLEVGVSASRFHDYGHWNAISYNGPDSLNPATLSPHDLYQRLFSSSRSDQESAREVLLLDAVLEESRSLQQKLGAQDRQRLERHMDHIRGIEQRLQAGQQACMDPGLPPGTSLNLLEDTRQMAQLLAAAISCGLTRVFSFMLTSPASTHVFNEVPEVTLKQDMHTLCHNTEGSQDSWESVKAATRYQMQCFATFLDAFNTESMPGASLLEQGVILGTSEYGEGWKHSIKEMPVLLAGGGAGTLNKMVHTRLPTQSISMAHLTALRALGLKDASFGWSGGQTSEVIPGFLKS